ncbi:MAG: chemotaxis protein CheA [Phycisphaerae bacterium]|nr:chemotaxis protein CheA [Phycisphaerae bacterium]
MSAGFGADILNDFLTESGELLESLEADLVVLERTPTDPDLLNRVFRSLHTIKGSASFLNLSHLVEIAHAAESALNAARGGSVTIDANAMNLLLAAVDTIKRQMDQVREGATLDTPDPALVSGLIRFGEGGGAAAESEAPAPKAAPANALTLRPEQESLVEFLVPEVTEAVESIGRVIEGCWADPDKPLDEVVELCEGLVSAVAFFELEPIIRLSRLIIEGAEGAAQVAPDRRPQVVARLRGCACLLRAQAEALARRQTTPCESDPLAARLRAILADETLPPEAVVPPTADAAQVLAVDGVAHAGTSPAATEKPEPDEHNEQGTAAPTAATPAAKTEHAKPDHPKAEHAKAEHTKSHAGEQTIRVDVERLETLMNLVGELVLQKNRIGALARRAAASGAAPELAEDLVTTSGAIERVTGDIQVAVMRTRMQPLDKLFGRYPRLVRDLSQKLGKKIELVIEGGDTEVDRSILEELGDPLVHLMRNSADHGIETPEARVAAGKPEVGTIRLSAANRGSHVVVEVGDDGRGLIREKLATKAIERGLATREEVAAMSDREVFRFIFAAGFSTADQVSDVSGRGVGMDVVRTNIERTKGTIDLTSEPGKGTTVSIKIPLTVAIMPAMMIGVGEEVLAVPLDSILEIVRPDPEQVRTVRQQPVMRLRDTVLPLVRGPEVFGLPKARSAASPFAVVLASGERRIGLMVTRLIGQQEIVVKPLSDVCEQTGPISGATVREDGGVSLIVDVAELFRRHDRKVAA